MFTKVKNECQKISNCERSISESHKYYLIIGVLFIVHIFFSIFFYNCDIPVLYIYNALSSILYGYLLYMIMKSRSNQQYISYLNIAFTEILFYASLSTVLLGWDYGFMVYLYAIPPVLFYLFFSSQNINGNLALPTIYTIIACVVYVSVRVYTNNGSILFEGKISNNTMSLMFYFNSILTFSFQVLFSFLFALEIKQIQKTLETENSHLDSIASLDPLTQLCNRRSMKQHLSTTMDIAKSRGTIYSIIIGDIDDFKKVNDTYGHDFGDKVLIRVADVLREQMRNGDYACRWGGEEFLLIINANKEISSKVTNRIRMQIQNSIITDEKENIAISVTMTFGIMEYMPGYSMERLIQLADENLYKGKQNGKNQVVY